MAVLVHAIWVCPLRSLFIYLLAALLLACPALCRATEVACCPGREAGACTEGPEKHAPDAPADSDDCICNGAAVKAEANKAGKHIATFAGPLLVTFETGLDASRQALHHGSRLDDPDDWLEPIRLHVVLQVFRC